MLVDKTLIFILLCFAPLIYGGNRPLALLFLEIIALLLVYRVARFPLFLNHVGKPFLVLFGLMIALPIIQLLPVPFSFWQLFTVNQDYAKALEVSLTYEGLAPPALALSLIPAQTEYSLLALLPPLAIFFACIGLSTQQLKALIPVFLAFAAFQALVALAEYGVGNAVNGTYGSRDHLAGMLEMAFPMTLSVLAASVAIKYKNNAFHASFAGKLKAWLDVYFIKTAIYACLSIFILLALVFTQSRTAVALSMVIIFVSALLYSRKLGGNNVFGMVGTYSVIGLGLAATIGLVPVLERFVAQDHLKDARWTIYASIYRVLDQFLPFGTGIGTFRDVYHRYHPEQLTGSLINRAHNDYLEWFMEGGVIAAVIMIGFLFYYFRRFFVLINKGQVWQNFRFNQIGAGVGLLAILLHSLLDFNLRIPANQIYFAFLAAIFFHQSSESHESVEKVEVAEFKPLNKPLSTSVIDELVWQGNDDRVAQVNKVKKIEPRTLPVNKFSNPFED